MTIAPPSASIKTSGWMTFDTAARAVKHETRTRRMASLREGPRSRYQDTLVRAGRGKTRPPSLKAWAIQKWPCHSSTTLGWSPSPPLDTRLVTDWYLEPDPFPGPPGSHLSTHRPIWRDYRSRLFPAHADGIQAGVPVGQQAALLAGSAGCRNLSAAGPPTTGRCQGPEPTDQGATPTHQGGVPSTRHADK